jgi:hypothetical protein
MGSRDKELKDVFKALEDLRDDLKSWKSDLKKSISQQFENMNDSLTKRLEQMEQQMKDHLELEAGKLEKKIELLEIRVGSIEERDYSNPIKPFDPEMTVVGINLPEEPDEILTDKIADLLNIGLGIRDIEPLRIARLSGKNGKPGIIKMEMPRKEDKINVLRAKQKLKDSPDYRRVYLRSSLTHAERLIQLNFKEILQDLPNGGNYRITGHGRVIRNLDAGDNQIQDSDFQPTGPTRRRGGDGSRGAWSRSWRGRGRGRIRQDAS